MLLQSDYKMYDKVEILFVLCPKQYDTLIFTAITLN